MLRELNCVISMYIYLNVGQIDRFSIWSAYIKSKPKAHSMEMKLQYNIPDPPIISLLINDFQHIANLKLKASGSVGKKRYLALILG
jgi:hypothetical protein